MYLYTYALFSNYAHFELWKNKSSVLRFFHCSSETGFCYPGAVVAAVALVNYGQMQHSETLND